MPVHGPGPRRPKGLPNGREFTRALRDEALCYGWIDSLLKPIDADRYAQRFSPRRPTSRLSAMNRERVRRLIAAGRMTGAGLESIKHAFDHRRDAKPRPKWEIPKDILRRLKGDRTIWRNV